jgi:hypothetical protein
VTTSKNIGRSAGALAHAQVQRERWAVALVDQDAELLALRDGGLTLHQLGVRYGISDQAAWYRVQSARRRQQTRSEMAG